MSFRHSSGADFVGRLEGDAISVLEAPDMVVLAPRRGPERHRSPGLRRAKSSWSPRPAPAERPRLLRVRGPRGRPAGAAAAARSRPPGTRRPSSTSRTPRQSTVRAQAVRRPAATQMLDFELEIAAVIGSGRRDRRLHADERLVSARDVQAQEMTVGPRPGKGQGLRHVAGPLARDPGRAADDRRAPGARGDGERQRRGAHAGRARREKHWSLGRARRARGA